MVKKLSWLILVAVVLNLCIGGFAVLSQGPVGEMLKYTATSNSENQTGSKYWYWMISNEAYVFQPGDCLEYDVYLEDDSKGLGAVEVYLTDNTYLRDQKGWRDQFDISGHPGASMSLFAYKNWYHRKLPIPETKIGKTSKSWDVVTETNSISTTYTTYYDNIVITNNGKIVKTIYKDGNPQINLSRGGTGYSCKLAVVPAIPITTPEPTPSPDNLIKLTLKIDSNSLTTEKNGYKQNILLDAAPIIRESRTYLPIRQVVEELGGTIKWDAELNRVDILQGETKISLWINKSEALVNNSLVPIDSANSYAMPIIVPPGRTMIPLRFVSENLGAQVDWLQDTQTIVVKKDTRIPKITYKDEILGNKLTVGAYYYPWYTKTAHWKEGYLRTLLTPGQKPLIGEYDCDDPKVAEQHIKWAKEYGVDYFMLSWWGPNSPTNKTIQNGFLKAENLSDIKYGILYETTGRFNNDFNFTQTTEFTLKSDFAYLAKNYFNQPGYLKYQGKPVIFMYATRPFAGDYDIAIKNVRSYIKNEYGYDLFIWGDEVGWGSYPERKKLNSFDAITLYNPYNKEFTSQYHSESGFLERVDKLYSNNLTVALTNKNHFIPNIIPGYNDRGVRLETDNPPFLREMNKGDEGKETLFSEFLEIGYKYRDPELNTIMITSWNEWHEDSQIEPTIVDGSFAAEPAELTGGYTHSSYGFRDLEIIKAFKGKYSK